MASSNNDKGFGEMSFLDHLEALRWHLVRAVAAVVIITIIVFINKKFLFDSIILAPKSLDFLTYQALCWMSNNLHLADKLCITQIPFKVINIEMAGQFLLHIKVSFGLGFVLAFPYVFWEIWRFIAPALYEKELKYSQGIVFYSSILFITGILFGYYILAPFSINFLGSYRVSDEIMNTISLGSYINIVLMLVILSGIIFELPILVYLLSKIGILTPAFMRKYRKHAFLVIIILSAVITPPDVTSQILIAIPLYLLYEVSIFISAKVNKNRQ